VSGVGVVRTDIVLLGTSVGVVVSVGAGDVETVLEFTGEGVSKNIPRSECLLILGDNENDPLLLIEP
jgi:hypothetical protein